jgi:hypothetical protein
MQWARVEHGGGGRRANDEERIMAEAATKQAGFLLQGVW